MTAHIRREPRRYLVLGAMALLIAAVLVSISPARQARATSGGDPYSVTYVTDTNPAAHIVETTLIAENTSVDIGGGVTANAETFNGHIPGPTFQLEVGDTVIVHYENHLDEVSGIHWHGIELSNSMDGTPFTQNQVPAGGKFLYKFKVSRPGIFWYHPHHHSSTNQVFKGLYGMILVTDPNNAALVSAGRLPDANNTLPMVLSDTTVCKNPGSNDAFTYPTTLPWVGPLDSTPGAPQNGLETGVLPQQAGPHPVDLCETHPIDIDGHALPSGTTFHVGDIPNIQTFATNGRTNEGQTVLTNGMNVGGRAGKPTAPGALDAGASTYDVKAGQGLRLLTLNAASTRFFRLRLTDQAGNLVPLWRVGGEGGLLDQVVEEGGVIGGFDTKYNQGEILLDPGSRADLVIAVPASASNGDVLTLWTEDYDRTGMGFSNVPTVPVAHFKVNGSTTPFVIGAGTGLRSFTGDPVPALGAPTGTLLDPSTFSPAKVGSGDQNIKLTQTGSALGIDGVFGTHDVSGDYTLAPHIGDPVTLVGSTRYAKLGDTLELTVENTTGGAHHPFHLHGFSMQPVSLTKTGGGGPDYIWPYREFRDNIDVPPGYTLTFRIKLTDRALPDGTTMGGGYGRWLFHCHIFFHATNGMLGELVVVQPNGNEKPDVNADTTQVEVNEGTTATATGTYHDVDGGPVALSASFGTVTDTGGGTWSWSGPTTNGPSQSQFVYVKATDSGGLADEAVFYLKVNNVAPTVTISSPADNSVFVTGTPVTVTAHVADPGTGDTETCTFNWDGGGPTTTATTPANGDCSQTNTFSTPGTYHVSVSADDGDGGTNSASVTIKIVTAKSLKQDVLAQATTLLAGATAKADADRLSTVVSNVTDSLTPANWVDGNHINSPPPAGNQVFVDERNAVRALMNEMNDPNSVISDPTLQALVDNLVFADKILAQVAIADAIAGGGSAPKIASAQSEMSTAAGLVSSGQFDAAIDHYKNAWNKAIGA
jgi:FtsP/CotA-like multicopper oxidase with cupredoxin domain